MPGYVISLNTSNENELFELISKGVYGTKLNIKETWTAPVEGTLADYFSMETGDHIYFFRKRKLYGIGELTGIGNYDCKLLNYENADVPGIDEVDNSEMIIPDSSIRFICTFKASPAFFTNGLDMDYVLQSNPIAFKMLRAFWKLSFIKIDDVEDKALFDIILRENFRSLESSSEKILIDRVLHQKIERLDSNSHELTASKIIQYSRNGNLFQREMGLECAMISYLMENHQSFGKWDYLSHQVVASPFKPIDYMDKIDIFGYKQVPNYKTINGYLVMELKKEKAGKEVVDQIMKYVDWVNDEYSHGDFDMIEAFIIANTFENDIFEYINEVGVRSYSKNKPAINKIWRNLRVFKYEIEEDNTLFLNEVFYLG
ncbi:hypothetical protein [Enterococcus sp. LJL90]